MLKSKSVYYSENCFFDHPILVDVKTDVQVLPHLITWSPTEAIRSGNLNSANVMDIVMPYLANMNDDERLLVESQLRHIGLFHQITGIDCWPCLFMLYTEVNGQPVSMCVVATNIATTLVDGVDLD